MTQGFDEWMITAVSWSERDCYEAGAASRQEEVLKLQAEIDAILSLIDKHQYSSGERILKEVKELLK